MTDKQDTLISSPNTNFGLLANEPLQSRVKPLEFAGDSVARKIRITAADGKGQVSRKQAEEKALTEYAEFNTTQPLESDFEKEVKRILSGKIGGGDE